MRPRIKPPAGSATKTSAAPATRSAGWRSNAGAAELLVAPGSIAVTTTAVWGMIEAGMLL